MTKEKSRLAGNITIIATILLMVVLMNIWYGVQRFHSFHNHHLETIKQEVELISKYISSRLDTIQTQTGLFAEVHKEQLANLALNPDDELLYEEIQENMQYMLQGSMRFNVIDSHGEVLVTDYEGYFGPACRADIRGHMDSAKSIGTLVIHPNPNSYHFDVIADWQVGSANGAIIISYDPLELSEVLSQKVLKDNQLIILRDGIDGLIEMTEGGARNALNRPYSLTDAEKQRIGHIEEIPETVWALVGLFPEDFFLNEKKNIILEVLLSAIAMIVVFVFLLWKFTRESRRAAKAEVFLSNIIDNLPGVVFRAELSVKGEMSYSYISPGAEDVLGYSAKELRVNPGVLFRATHSDDFGYLFDQMQQSAVQLTPLRIEYRIIKKGGDFLWVREIARPQKNDNGDIIWNGIILDISDLKESEQKLFVHYSALNAASDSILITDTDGIIQWVNPALSKLTGYSSEELRGQGIGMLFDEQTTTDRGIAEAISSDKHWVGELVYKQKDSGVFTADTTLTPIFDQTGDFNNFIAIIRDLSEKKSLETQLLSAQKMESIGQLAAGIAHEINTPTQFVSDNVHFLQEVVEDAITTMQALEKLEQQIATQALTVDQILPVIHDLIEEADLEFIKEEAPAAVLQSLDGLGRIASIVGAMKDFSHPGSMDMDSIDLNQIINTTVIIARNEWKYVAELKTDLTPDLPAIPADSQLLGQTILNIIVNAAHAISERQEDESVSGLITISTRILDDMVEMRISDNGMGMPEEVKQRIFEPFFTTKEVGKGSGQGLAIAYSGIVEKHRGSIDIETEVGVGTTFVICLPVEQ